MAKEMSEFEAFNHINSLFGGSVRTAQTLEQVDVISTQSISLDRALGVGGWPRGRLIQLAGEPSAGKTALALMAIAEWQSLDPENCAAFLDAEYTYDPDWAESLGVDNNRVLLVKDNSGVNIFTGLVGESKKNAKTKKITKIPGLLDFVSEGKILKAKNPQTGDVITLNCGKMGVMVLDSVASINTPMEEEASVGSHHMAVMGRFLSVELKKLTPALGHSNVSFIAINQVRTSPGVMFGDPTSTPGGKALHHACSVMVMLSASKSKDNKILNEDEEQVGTLVMAKVDKNKVGRPFRKAQYRVRFDQGIVERAEEILDTGCLTGIIERPNSRSYIIGEEKLTSRDAALRYVQEHIDDIEELVRNSFLNPSSSKSEELEYEEEVLENPLLQGVE